jgi:DNA repair protein RecO (recombination protein O)
LISPITSDALVLRTYEFGETSKIVVLLTRERGKLRAVAKGARHPRSRIRSALEPLSEVRVGLHGRQGAELLRLGECELVRSAFPAGRRGLETLLALSYFAELIDAFAQEGEADENVYRLARAVITAAEEGTPADVLTPYLEAWLLRLHGVYPPIDKCSSCGVALEPGELAYHRGARGFVCDRCGEPSGPRIGAPTAAFLARLFREPPASLKEGPTEPAELERLHHELICHHLEREPRSYRVMRELSREAHT